MVADNDGMMPQSVTVALVPSCHNKPILHVMGVMDFDWFPKSGDFGGKEFA
jgi:hypothetical protein